MTCMFKIDEKNIDEIFNVCCMALYLIEAEIERNIRLRNSYFDVYRKQVKRSHRLSNHLWSAYGDYGMSVNRLKSVAKTVESIMTMQFNRCSLGFEISGMDVPLEHMHKILAYAREHKNTLENSI